MNFPDKKLDENIRLQDITRFLNKIQHQNNCWIWTGAKENNGYGQFNLNQKTRIAHRLSYELFIGDIPNGKELDHLCKNRSCVNPDHLEPVTHKENIRRGSTGKHQNHHNKFKTQCPRGHNYSGVNKKGSRICKICDNQRKKHPKKLVIKNV